MPVRVTVVMAVVAFTIACGAGVRDGEGDAGSPGGDAGLLDAGAPDGGGSAPGDGGAAAVSIAVSPAQISLAPGASWQFQAVVTNASLAGVTWSVAEGGAGGTIDQRGLYTAPKTSGSDTVIATSVAAAGVSGSASVTIVANDCCDGGALADGGAIDAGTVSDAGTASDGGEVSDAGAASDGGEAADAGSPADGGEMSDAGAPIDGGVASMAPGSFSYGARSLYCQTNTLCSSGAAVRSDAAAATFSASPTLPSGLSIDAATGAISGTVAAPKPPAAFTITAQNASGSSTAQLTIAAASGQSQWMPIGPPGLPTQPVAVQVLFDPSQPQRAWLSAGAFGLLVTEDGMQSWTPLAGPGPASDNYDIATGTDGTLYALDVTAGPFVTSVLPLSVSRDHGQSWTAHTPPAGMAVVTVDPADSSTVYLNSAGTPGYLSRDSGATWTPVATLPGTDQNGAFVFDLAGQTLYASTENNLFANSSFAGADGGSWTAINDGLQEGPLNLSNIAADPHAPGALYVASGYSGTVYRSSNGGESWSAGGDSELDGGGFRPLLLIDPSSTPSTIYLADQTGIAVSRDGARTFSVQSFPKTGLQLEAVQPQTGDEILADQSELYSVTPGGTFTQLPDTGLDASDVVSIAADAAGNLYVATSTGTKVSRDQGASWQTLDPIFALQVLVDPKNGALLEWTGAALKVSFDGGQSWSSEPNTTESSFAFMSDGTLCALAQGGFARSSDDGATFTVSTSGLVDTAGDPATAGEAVSLYGFALDGATNTVLAVAGGSFPGYGGHKALYRSLDGGLTWSLARGAPDGDQEPVYDLIAADPAHAGVFYVITDQGLLVTSDRGASFSAVTSGPPAALEDNRGYSFFAISPFADHTFYYGTLKYESWRGGLLASSDGGATWTAQGSFVNDEGIAFADGQAFVATETAGVMASWPQAAPLSARVAAAR